MVLIDQFRISDDGRSILLDLHVSNATRPDGDPLYENVFLKSIKLKAAGITSEAAPTADSSDECIFSVEFQEKDEVKEIHYVISINDVLLPKGTFSQDLLFLFVETQGAPDPCVPCRCDECVTTDVTFDTALLHQRVMGYAKELGTSCKEPSKELIDFILLWSAFNASVETEHWNEAVRFYKMLFIHSVNSTYKKNCGCNG